MAVQMVWYSGWDSFAQNGTDGSWSVDCELGAPYFVYASSALSMYENNSANCYAYSGISSYTVRDPATGAQTVIDAGAHGDNHVTSSFADNNVVQISFLHGLGCGDGLGVLASTNFQVLIWE